MEVVEVGDLFLWMVTIVCESCFFWVVLPLLGLGLVHLIKVGHSHHPLSAVAALRGWLWSPGNGM